MQQSGLSNYSEQHIILVAFSESPKPDQASQEPEFVNNDTRKVGQNAAKRLLQRLNHHHLPEQHIILPPELIT